VGSGFAKMRIPTENNAGEFCQTHLITSEP
jgi:hypothetical protein